MSTIMATFHVTTPMFLGGADGTKAELRAASFKGVLRFWWRACAWSRFGSDLGAICAAEEQIFGWAQHGQSAVSINLTASDVTRFDKDQILKAVAGPGMDGARYLGYGVMETASSKKKGVRAGQLVRGCLGPGFTVTAVLRLQKRIEDKIDLIIEALRALGTLGGMGSRSRRGYGSMSLRSLAIEDADGTQTTVPVAGDIDSLQASLRAFGTKGTTGIPPYTALSGRSQVWIGPPGEPMAVLSDLGVRYRNFRKGLVGDKDIVLNDAPGHPQRVAFGLPINYGEGKPVIRPTEHDRRASPLFFHVHDCGGQAVPVVAFLPALFLPADEHVTNAHREFALPDVDVLYEPVDRFLRGLVGFTEVTRG